MNVLKICRYLMERLEEETERTARAGAAAERITRTLSFAPAPCTRQDKSDCLCRLLAAKERVERLNFALFQAQIDLERLLKLHLDKKIMVQILFYRYGLCLKFNAISQLLGQNLSTIYYFHRIAKKIFLKSLD